MIRRLPIAVTAAALAAVIAGFAGASIAMAESADERPEGVKDVGVTEHLGEQVPADLEFVDSEGNKVTLGKYFDGERPLVLTMNYSSCPMLCSMQLNGLFDSLEKMPWDIGNQFDMITVSIDPSEIPLQAKTTKQNYLKVYGRDGAAAGYHLLVGEQANIKALADAVGYHYKRTEDGEYAHAAVTMILTPDGRLSRYLYGVQYDPQTVRLSLYEAADGKVGSTMDKILLFCFAYDPERGKYGLAAITLMKFGGGLTVVMLAGTFWILRRREKNTSRETGSTEIGPNQTDSAEASDPTTEEVR